MTLVYVACRLECQKFQSISHKVYSSLRMALVYSDKLFNPFHDVILTLYEAYSESKYRFAVKNIE